MSKRAVLLTLGSLTVVVPVLSVVVGGRLFWQITERAFVQEEVGVDGFQLVWAAAPLLLITALAAWPLARFNTPPNGRSWLRTGIVGALVTLALWGYYHWEGYTYWRDKETTGADFGVIFLMLGSPVIVALAMLLTRLVTRARGPRHEGA